jgi:type IV pilus assembly protein PilC
MGGVKLANYVYVAVDSEGKQRKGSMEANGTDQIYSNLKSEGLTVISVKEGSILDKDLNLSIGGKKKITPRDMSVFCKQFVSILAAGVTIINALEMLSDQTENPTLQEAIKNVMLSVQQGDTLAEAMKKEPDAFPSILVNMVKAGESSGSLEVAFDRMSVHFEKTARIKAMVKKAMIYPVVVSVVMVGVIIVMMVMVIPSFQKMFKDMNMDLPTVTKIVVAMSDFIINKWYILIALVAAIIVGFKVFASSDTGRVNIAKFKMNAPVLGNMTIKSACSNFSRTMSTLLAAGLSIIDALEITANTMDNLLYKEALMKVREEVTRGEAMSKHLTESGLFPPMVCQMTRIGEETGNIEDMLNKIADYYDEEVQVATESLSAAMEPMIIVVMALMVGFLVMAIMTPMFSMYSGIDNM